MKMNLIAKSCFSPGLITLVSNLITSSADFNEDTDERWLEEYTEGMGHEIYRIKLSDKMERKYFKDIARIIYRKTKTIVFAIQVKCNNGKTVIRLNPNDFLVNNIQENEIHVYAICPDKVVAESIETIEMTKEEKARYFVNKEKKSQEDKIFNEENIEDDNGSTSSEDEAAQVQMQVGYPGS
jgi:potassium large conductance calcium-activated channel subfamily M alpha member 1